MQKARMPMESLIKLLLLQMETGGKARLTVTGSSMLPMLRPRMDAVMLVPISGRLNPGDIALYQRDNGRYVLHRVMKLTHEGYLFCGDNQARLEPVRQNQLIALVSAYIKKDKQHTLDETGYRLYCWMCLNWFVMRKYYIPLRRTLGRLLRCVYRRKEHG